MTREFKPGDKVRSKYAVLTVEHVNTKGKWIHFAGGMIGGIEHYELAEPSVTHRELREVLAELKQRDPANTSWSAALEAYFFQLTGERP